MARFMCGPFVVRGGERSVHNSETPPSNLRQLRAVILLTWTNIPPQWFQLLVKFMSRKFAEKLPHRVCHDKLISRKITLAASVRAIWGYAPILKQDCFQDIEALVIESTVVWSLGVGY
ncbi:hypothetical protein AVEN_227169-1 [Araneus ventricosus]|uniref:Uncharacterized protein n=1 Tax=Araneus ventricosus TaxID=182803 RepID=A0A4Y2BV23_ARAVE|nr:hypothetical protein AVEN_227169-1 [Araneus ventricosus]